MGPDIPGVDREVVEEVPDIPSLEYLLHGNDNLEFQSFGNESFARTTSHLVQVEAEEVPEPLVPWAGEGQA